MVTTRAGGIPMEGEGADVLRFPGFASEPNSWGSLLLMLFPMAWAAITSRAVRRSVGIGIAVAALLVAAGAATFSTYTQLAVGVAAALAILFGLLGHRLGPILTSILISIGAALTVLTVQGYGDDVLDKLTTYTTGTNAERFYAGLAGIRMWFETPLFGFGLGAYPTHYQDFADVQMLPVESAHSVVLATLAEQGLVGLLALILLLFALLFLGITGNLHLYYHWFYAGLQYGLAIQVAKTAGPTSGPQATRKLAPA